MKRRFPSVGVSPSQLRERERVARILANDIAIRNDERRRVSAVEQFENGHFANITDIPIPPTPEQLSKEEYRAFTADKIDGTVRAIETVRKVQNPRIVRLHMAGVIDDDLFAACAWYRRKWEQSGLDVAISAVQYGDRIAGLSEYGFMPKSERQAIARDEFRGASEAINPSFRALFNAVVLEDMTIDRASKFYRHQYRAGVASFRAAALDLHGFAASRLPIRQALEK